MLMNPVPEILRSNLLSVALQLLALGIQDLIEFDFINKPSLESLNASLNELELLGAIKPVSQSPSAHQNTETSIPPQNKKQRISQHKKYELTEMGKRMVQFPLDPKLSRCILAAEKLNCVEEVLKIVSMLSVDNVFSSTISSKKEQAHQARQKFISADGDHITLLNVYKTFVANKSSSKEWCHENFLDLKNLRLAVDICKQLRDICNRQSIRLSSSSSDSVSVRKALISGFFMNAAEYQRENEYKTVVNQMRYFNHAISRCIIYRSLVDISFKFILLPFYLVPSLRVCYSTS